MVLKDKTKNYLYLTGYFLFLFLILLIINEIIYVKAKNNNIGNFSGIINKENFQKYENKFKESKKENEKVKITFWHNLYPEEEQILKEIISEFEKEYPGIKVLASNKGNWGQIFKHVTNALTVDKQPNLVVSYPDHTRFYFNSGKVIPLNKFSEVDEEFAKNLKTFPFLEGYFEPIQIEDNKEEEGIVVDKNNRYYLPFLKTTEIMFYDSSLLKETYKELKDKSSNTKEFKEFDKLVNQYGCLSKESLQWSDMEKICQILKQKKAQDFIPIIVDSESNLFIISAKQKNIKYPISKNDIGNFLNEDAIKDILEKFKDLYDNKHLTLSKLTGEENIKTLINNKSFAFYITSTRRLDTLSNMKDFTPHFHSIPTFDVDKNILQGSNVNLFYSAKEEEIFVSWFFAKYLALPKVNEKFLLNNKFFNITRKNYFNKNNNEIEKIIERKINDNRDYSNGVKDIRKKFFKEFILKNPEKENEFFITSTFENSDFFRNIITDLFIDVLQISPNDANKRELIQKLLNQTIQRIQTN